MKCIHGISVRKPCAKCREDWAKPEQQKPTWRVGEAPKSGDVSDQDWINAGCPRDKP